MGFSCAIFGHDRIKIGHEFIDKVDEEDGIGLAKVYYECGKCGQKTYCIKIILNLFG